MIDDSSIKFFKEQARVISETLNRNETIGLEIANKIGKPFTSAEVLGIVESDDDIRPTIVVEKK